MYWLARLRSRLIALTLFSLMPLFGVIVYDVYDHRARERMAALSETERVATNIIATQSRVIESAKSFLNLMMLIPAVRALDTDACGKALAALLQEQPRYANLGVARLDGSLACSAVPASGPVTIKDRSWFQHALSTRDFAIGDYQIGRIVGKPVLSVARPMLDAQEKPIGVVYASLDLAWFSNNVAGLSLPPGGVFVMIGRGGTVLGRYPNQALWLGKSVKDSPLFQAMTTRNEQHVELAGLDNVVRVFHLSQIRATPAATAAYVGVGQSIAPQLAEIDRDLWLRLLGLVAFGAVLLGLAYVAGERVITRPANRLIALSNRIGSGDLAARSDLDPAAGEFGELGASLDKMAGSLQRHQAELAEQTRMLVESQATARVGSWEWRLDDPFIACSTELRRIFGFDSQASTVPLEEMIAAVHPDDRQICFDMSRKASEEKTSVQFEFRLQRPDGEIRYCWSIIRVDEAKSTDGKSIVYGTTQDITERKLAEIERQRSDALFRGLFVSAADGTVICDESGSILHANPSAERMFGYESGALTGQKVEILVPEKAAAIHAGLRRSYTTAPEVRPMHGRRNELSGLRRDGATFPVAISLIPVVTDERAMIVATIHDLTDRRALDLQLRQAQKMEAIGQLTGGIAHDFNNLLGIIIGNLDWLLLHLEKSEQREVANEALEGALRGAELTKQMLAFARRQPLDPTMIDVAALLKNLVTMLRRTLGEAVTVSVAPAKDLWPCVADPSQLESVLLNLAINARDAMPKGGSLIIEATKAHLDQHYAEENAEVMPGDYVRISVSDTGTGMPAEILARVMEPFFTTKASGKGTGLGLSMVYGFAKQSGGHLKIYSEEGHGTTVNLYLPRARSMEKTDDGHKPAEAEIGGHETILLVDDNIAVRKSAARQLKDLGYNIIEAEDARSALALLAHGHKVDLLFSDIVMPGGMSGIDLAQEVRRLYPELKILLVTGFAESAARSRNGFGKDVQLMTKPYRRQELALRIREVLKTT